MLEMFKKKKTVKLIAKQRTKIFSRKFSSVPMEYEFSVKPINSQALSGQVDVEISRTIFKNTNYQLPLQEKHVIKAGFWDTFMDVYVTADDDIEVELPKRRMGSKPVIIGLILVVLALASILMITALNQ
jgi:hypothetical protein